jgi:membrane-bound lytic murein transglycosylase D
LIKREPVLGLVFFLLLFIPVAALADNLAPQLAPAAMTVSEKASTRPAAVPVSNTASSQPAAKTVSIPAPLKPETVTATTPASAQPAPRTAQAQPSPQPPVKTAQAQPAAPAPKEAAKAPQKEAAKVPAKEAVKTAEKTDDGADAEDDGDDDPDDAEESPADFIKSMDTQVVTAPAGPTPIAATKPGDSCPAKAQETAAVTADAASVNGSDEPFQLFGGVLHESVDKNVRYFSSTIKNHFSRWLARSGKYLGLMKSIFRENYLPEDLVFLALIESGFNPKAYSWAKACGPWQFIKGTGQKYGLKVDRWVDERRDPVKSTKAAAAYLKDLYGMFGSWPLAMASYNAGEGNVARAVTRNGTDDFWELRKTRSLAPETKEYVPKFMAAQMIAQDPEKFGFDNVEYEQPFEFDEVVLDRCTDLKVVAKCCGVDVSDIKELNPELIRWCTPPNRQTYTLRIPKGTKEIFLASYAQLPEVEKLARPSREDLYDHYTVRRGDTLKKIARRHHTTETALASANGLEPGFKVRRGQRLVLPANVASDDGGSRRRGKASRYSSYKVRKGDSLASVAKKRGMSVSKLAAMNGLSTKAHLKPGQRLKTYASSSKGSSSSKSKVARSRHGRKKKTYTVKKGENDDVS